MARELEEKEHALMGWSIPIAAGNLELERPGCSLRYGVEVSGSGCGCAEEDEQDGETSRG